MLITNKATLFRILVVSWVCRKINNQCLIFGSAIWSWFVSNFYVGVMFAKASKQVALWASQGSPFYGEINHFGWIL